MFSFLGDNTLIMVFYCFSVLLIAQVFDIILLPTGGGRDPGGAGEVGASAEPAHSGAEKDPQ